MPPNVRSNAPRRAAAILAVVIAFAAVLLAIPPRALGLTPDSVQYHSAARSFLDGGRLLTTNHNSWEHPDSIVPLKHYPPGLSLAVAAGMATGADFRVAASWVNALAAAIWVACLILLLRPRLGTRAAITVAAAAAITPDVVLAHQYFMSEPLYFAAIAATLLVMVRKPEQPLAYGAAAAISSMVRYAGLSAILAACTWAIMQPGTLRRRLARGVIAGLPSLLIQGWWQLRILRSGQRVASFNAPGEWDAEVPRIASVGSRWLAPGIEHDVVRVLVGGVLLGTIAALVWRRLHARAAGVDRIETGTIIGAAGVMLGWHIIVLVVLRSTTYIIPFDQRMLAPLEFLAMIVAGVLIAIAWSRSARSARIGLAGALAVWTALAVRADAAQIDEGRTVGIEYGKPARMNAESVRWIREHGRGIEFFTNAHANLYFNAGRHSRYLPVQWTPAERDRFADTVRARNGLIAVFDFPAGKVKGARELIAELPVTVVQEFPDATIYRIRPR